MRHGSTDRTKKGEQCVLLETISHLRIVSEISNGVGVRKRDISKISFGDGGGGDSPECFK